MNSKRRTVIAGNWKMNFTPAEATAFINEIKPMVAGKDACDVIFCAPYVTIAAAQAAGLAGPVGPAIPAWAARAAWAAARAAGAPGSGHTRRRRLACNGYT